MKILMLVNWKVEYCNEIPYDKQPPDYVAEGRPYWFFRYFKQRPEVDVVDIRSFPWLERFEKEKLRFYVWQTLKVIPRLREYDLILSHGMQSGIVLSLWRTLFPTKAKHIVFDIGAFNSGAEKGLALRLMQLASKSIDGVIYHTSSQKQYYERFYPWLAEKSRFIPFGTDLDFFRMEKTAPPAALYMICVGSAKRDWKTLIEAYRKLGTTVQLKLIGRVDPRYNGIAGVEQLPVIPIRELIEQIRGASFCVLPLESFPYSCGQMTLMQQMALGKCVIAADVPSLGDYIEDGVTAITYPAGDAEALAKKLEWAIANPEERDAIACRGMKYLAEQCNETIMAEEIERFILPEGEECVWKMH